MKKILLIIALFFMTSCTENEANNNETVESAVDYGSFKAEVLNVFEGVADFEVIEYYEGELNSDIVSATILPEMYMETGDIVIVDYYLSKLEDGTTDIISYEIVE